MIRNILMLCVGNICRSPIAEALLFSHLQHPSITVHSAGIGALVGYPADPTSQQLMLGLGLDISKHRARQFTPELGRNADLILTMTLDQQQHIESTLPGLHGRVHRLGKWGGFDILDPYQRPKIIFEQALALIEEGVHDWHKRLWT